MTYDFFQRMVIPVASALVIVACGGKQEGAGGPGGGAFPPSGVEVVTLEQKPVEHTTEFVASLKSRRSSTIQPQVEGFITRIAVRSGERVGQGALLFEVDSGPQQAVLAGQQSMRVARVAEFENAQQQAARTRKLFEAGAASQRDAEDADTALRTAQAQLKAVEEQVKQQRAELGYYKVTAPSTGIVGDIPVHVGDRVTKSTMMTTVEENQSLEIYVNVPVSQASHLKTGLPLRIMNDAGDIVATNPLTFVSPSVDTTTQTILAKATLNDGRGQYRADQFVRVRIVWSADPGFTIPVTAVQRIAGQYFAFVAEKGDKGGFVAKQKAIQVGDIVGNDYVVNDGLKVGDQLIVAGLQKIGDGAPVSIVPSAGTAVSSPAADGKKGQ
ncbi:MAG: efflux RND transporter periplasmic adaptor subunit [Vicinamibacteria bacterium]